MPNTLYEIKYQLTLGAPLSESHLEFLLKQGLSTVTENIEATFSVQNVYQMRMEGVDIMKIIKIESPEFPSEQVDTLVYLTPKDPASKKRYLYHTLIGEIVYQKGIPNVETLFLMKNIFIKGPDEQISPLIFDSKEQIENDLREYTSKNEFQSHVSKYGEVFLPLNKNPEEYIKEIDDLALMVKNIIKEKLLKNDVYLEDIIIELKRWSAILRPITNLFMKYDNKFQKEILIREAPGNIDIDKERPIGTPHAINYNSNWMRYHINDTENKSLFPKENIYDDPSQLYKDLRTAIKKKLEFLDKTIDDTSLEAIIENISNHFGYGFYALDIDFSKDERNMLYFMQDLDLVKPEITEVYIGNEKDSTVFWRIHEWCLNLPLLSEIAFNETKSKPQEGDKDTLSIYDQIPDEVWTGR